MRAPQRYKRTDLGVIPEDWESVTLGLSCDLVTKGTTPTSIGRTFSKSGIAFLKAETIDDSGKTIPEKIAYIDAETHSLLRRSQLRRHDVLVSIAGVLGRVGLIQESDLPANTNQALAIVRLAPNSQFDTIFLFHALRSSWVARQIRDISVQAAQANISLKNVRDFLLPRPPLAEQRLIAEAMSDMDSLLCGLDRLIAKKTDLKKAAMNQLLTGRTRLPGFQESWELKRIGELTDCVAGGTPSTRVHEYWGGSIRWMSSGELSMKRVHEVEGRITEEGLRSSSAKLIPPNCVLVGLAGQGRTRGTVAISCVELCTNQSIAAILPQHSFVPEYVYHNLDSRYDELRELSSGDGGRGGLNLALIKSLSLPFPPLSEQIAIAAVLSDIDAELSALEVRRKKTRALKHAMMQELLAGRVRLETLKTARKR